MSPAGTTLRAISASLLGSSGFASGSAASPRSPDFTACAWQSTSAPRKIVRRSSGKSARSMPALISRSIPGRIVMRRLRSSALALGSTLQSRSSMVCSRPCHGGEPSPSVRCADASAPTHASSSMSRTANGTHARGSRRLAISCAATTRAISSRSRSSINLALRSTMSFSARFCASMKASTRVARPRRARRRFRIP